MFNRWNKSQKNKFRNVYNRVCLRFLYFSLVCLKMLKAYIPSLPLFPRSSLFSTAHQPVFKGCHCFPHIFPGLWAHIYTLWLCVSTKTNLTATLQHQIDFLLSVHMTLKNAFVFCIISMDVGHMQSAISCSFKICSKKSELKEKTTY